MRPPRTEAEIDAWFAECGGLGGRRGVGYFTVQVSANAPGGRHLVHLGEYGQRAALGPIVCGLDRFGRDPFGNRIGFTCGGGTTDPDAKPCPGCLRVLLERPDAVGGLFEDLFEVAYATRLDALQQRINHVATCRSYLFAGVYQNPELAFTSFTPSIRRTA